MAEKFTQHTTVVPPDAANVDTDAIIPNSFAEGYAHRFWRPSVNDWRFLDEKY